MGKAAKGVRSTTTVMPDITERGMVALRRKFGGAEMSDLRADARARLLSRFVGELASKRFGAIVFGYEGVLCSAGGGTPSAHTKAGLEDLLRGGITVGMVSERDYEHVGAELRRMVPPEYWKSTYVGYCNGADISTLDADVEYQETDENLERFWQYAISDGNIPENIMARYPLQISIANGRNLDAAKIIQKAKSAGVLKDVKIFESGQSTTHVIPRHISRYDVTRRVKSAIPNDRHILCIGFDGRWPGCDRELLTHRHSLSTGTVSATAASCWNLLPAGEHGEWGTLSYLKGISITGDGRFSMTM